MEKYIFMKKEENFFEKNKKIVGIIFARAFCCMGIVIFHFFSHSKGSFKILYRTSNNSFGFMYVTTFFSISGAVLYYNYPKIKSIKSFYFKRWKSIFIPFYLCYIYYYLRNSMAYHKLLFKSQLSKLFITLIGFDSYLHYRIKNTCYLVGEWFLGAIIIIYLLYPLLSLFIIKNNYLIITFVFLINVFMYKTNFFIIPKSKNIISCLTSFYFGVITIKYKYFFFGNYIILLISFIILLSLSIFNITSFFFVLQIQGYCLYILLINIGQYIMQTKLNIIFKEISILSYNIFLFHHYIILDILHIINPIEWYLHIILLTIVFVLTIIYSKINLMVFTSIIESKPFKKFESLFI